MRIRATHLGASVLETASGFNRCLRHQASIATDAHASTDYESQVNAKSLHADATLSQRRDWMEEISKRRMQRVIVGSKRILAAFLAEYWDGPWHRSKRRRTGPGRTIRNSGTRSRPYSGRSY